MAKNITFETEGRDALKKGVDALANAVKVTSTHEVTPTHVSVFGVEDDATI